MMPGFTGNDIENTVPDWLYGQDIAPESREDDAETAEVGDI